MRLVDWTAELDGEMEVLSHLVQVLSAGSTRIERSSDGRFLLKLDGIRECTDPLVAENLCAATVRAAMGALNAFANIIGDASVGRVYGVDQHGANLGAGPMVRVKVRTISTQGKERLATASVGPRLLHLARERSNVARALGLLDNRDPSWADIYVLMELVEVDLRSRSPEKAKDWVAIQKKGWVHSSDVHILKRNGAFHRHVKELTPPSPAMPLWRAQVLCKAAIRAWLEELCAGAV